MTTATTIQPTANASDQTKSSGVQRGVVLPVALTLLAIFSTGTVHAVNYTWDPTSGDGQITDGTGNWDTTTSNWTTDAGATNVVAPSSAFGSDLFFGGGTAGTAGTITLMETGKEYGSLSFNSPNASSYDLDLNGNIVNIRRSAGTFKVYADATISDSSGGGELRHDTSQYRDYSTGSTLSVSAVVADRNTATVRTYDTITLDLSGVNTYTGGTEIYDSSTLRISGAGQLGSGTYAGTIAINNNGILDYNSSATQTLNGVISGSGSLVLNGSGQLNLSVNNSFSGGVTVNNGTLGLEISAIDGGPLTVNGGLVSGSIHDSFDNISVSELSGSGGLIEAARRTFTVTQATNTTYAGVIQDLNGIISDGNGTIFTKIGSGTLTLTGDNTYSKTTNVNGGTLEVSGGLYSAGTNGVSSNINIGAAGTLDVTGAGSLGLNSDFDGTITNDGILNYNSSATQTLTGIISGSGALTQSGAGTLTISGANTYTGATTVSAGILLINNTTGSGTGTGAVTVASGASLGGSGTISGATTIQSGGFLAPGNSPGILTFSGDLTLASGSFTNMEITGSTRGTDYDGIDVGGALTYGGGLTLTSNTLVGVGTYNLFDFTSESGDFTSIILSGTAYASNEFIQNGDVWDAIVDNQTYTYSQVTGNLVVATAAVPEPETFALLGGLLALTYVLGRRRRR